MFLYTVYPADFKDGWQLMHVSITGGQTKISSLKDENGPLIETAERDRHSQTVALFLIYSSTAWSSFSSVIHHYSEILLVLFFHFVKSSVQSSLAFLEWTLVME